MINIDSTTLWLIVGSTFIICEVFLFSGIGWLFIGLGALSNAVIIYTSPELMKYQYFLFGILSFIWLLLLWRPLKKISSTRIHSHIKNPSDLIGKEVEVFSHDLIVGKMGTVMWSGTIMNAELEDSVDIIAYPGQKLVVTKVKGNILICKNKK